MGHDHGQSGCCPEAAAERRGDKKMANLALQQIEVAFTASRDGGDAPSRLYEAQRQRPARLRKTRHALSPPHRF